MDSERRLESPPSAAELQHALLQARRDLDAARRQGRWTGQLASSVLSTATAVSALAVWRRTASERAESPEAVAESERRLAAGIEWIAGQANRDGGFGDTDLSKSNISTTLLVQAAFEAAGVGEQHAELLRRAAMYVEQQGSLAGLRARYGRDKTFAVPILANAAIAGLVPWSQVAALPFEFACLPQSWYRFARLPVVSYAIPALVAIGQAKFHFDPPWNPLTRAIRRAAVGRSLSVLERIQPASGGYLEAIPLTSFVAMALIASGRGAHPVAQRGMGFLRSSQRSDGSWPIDTNLATWLTNLAVVALAAAPAANATSLAAVDLDWILGCQNSERHPFTGAAPGGWGWSDLSGAVPDADDTPAALLALRALADQRDLTPAQRQTIADRVRLGIRWLLQLQNRDGGWPTFCRGWGTLPFDRSGADLTAHALRALAAWPDCLPPAAAQAVRRGWQYLECQQRGDGSWVPLWFGNQDVAGEENPIYGTCKVVRAYLDAGLRETPAAARGIDWLVRQQNREGGWGGGNSVCWESPAGGNSSVEETALAVEVLADCGGETAVQSAFSAGLRWLCRAVRDGYYQQPAPIGFYFAKLWYYEELYPIIFTVAALSRAVAVRGTSPSGSELARGTDFGID